MIPKKNTFKSVNTKRKKNAAKTAAPVQQFHQEDYFYMNCSNISSRTLYEAACQLDKYNTEYWSELDILEIEVTPKSSIDIEFIECEFKDEKSSLFLKENNIHTLCLFSFSSEIEKEAIEIMRHIACATDGFFAADTENFMPRING